MEAFARVRQLISDIRNSRDLEHNLPEFFKVVDENRHELREGLDIRWLVSICDTFADHGTEIERRNALLISMFVNMLRLAETHRFVSGPMQSARLELARGDPIELYEGVCTFSIDRQDVYLNLSKRMARALASTPFLESVWSTILERLHACPNAMTAMRDLSKLPERYFPADPLTLADNYGIR